jgi:hypothetical protein
MPDGQNLNLIIGTTPDDLKQVRVPGANKPFEEMTVGELVQLRAEGAAADSYNINAVTDNVSVSTSSVLEELGRIQAQRTMQDAQARQRLINLRGTLGPEIVNPIVGGGVNPVAGGGVNPVAGGG